jgi:protein involved in polysaccharide export with SLBB domain
MHGLSVMKYIAKLFITALGLLSLISCINAPVFESRGIPVRDYEATKSAEALAEEEKQKENLAAVSRLSIVKENSVFTERRGIPEYIVGPDDILTINFWSIAVGGAQTFEGFKQISYNVEVRADGKISYMYGDDIHVAGLTTSEIQQKLLADLRTYFRNPRLEVLVKEYKSKHATLFGQINTLPTGISGPGRYALSKKMTVIDLISKAGGPITGRAQYSTQQTTTATTYQTLIENADLTKVELLRNGKTYTFNLYKAMFYGDENQNPIIDAGDVITVPPEPYFADRIYVFGQVGSVGILRLKDAPDLLAAIALSGGMTYSAIRTDVKIIREFKERNGKPLIISANVNKALYQGDMSQNVKLMRGDVVYVPRMLIGDINEFILNTTPLLNYLLFPGTYRDAYILDQTKLRW